MRYFYARTKGGLTLVEILAAAVIVIIIALASYAAFLIGVKMRTFSKNKLDAYTEASRWLEQVRSGATDDTKYTSVKMGATGGPVGLNDTNSILPEDYLTWPLASNTQGLKAEYKIDDVNLGSGTAFKKITVKVNWTRPD